MSESKDTRQYLRQLRKLGYDYHLSRGNHYMITYGGKVVAVASGTPGGGRSSLANLKAEIRRFERARALAS